MTFREIEDGDVEAIVVFWQACGLTRPWNDPYKDISFARAGSTSTVLLGETGGKIVASAMVGHDGHRGMLYYVGVHPHHQGRGIGKAAVKAAEAWLAARGVWKVTLLVRTDNETSRGFYEKFGYEVSPVFCMARNIGG